MQPKVVQIVQIVQVSACERLRWRYHNAGMSDKEAVHDAVPDCDAFVGAE
jgi:hypothetical protein